MILTATKLKDLDVYLVDLPQGDYKIDGDVISVKRYKTNKAEIKNVNNITQITSSHVIEHYENDNKETISVSDYIDQKQALESKAEREDDYDIYFGDLEDEYKYKKFKQTWSPITRVVIKESEPIPVEIKESVYNTGSDYIRPILSNLKDKSLFEVDQAGIVSDVIRTIFAEMNKKYKVESCDSWTNSTHSGYEYCKIFGNYIFAGEPYKRYADTTRLPKQTMVLEDCLSLEKLIRDLFSARIKEVYAKKFAPELNSQIIKDAEFVNMASGIERKIAAIDPKQKTRTEFSLALKSARELKQYITEKFANNENI